jgi:ribosomal protein L22
MVDEASGAEALRRARQGPRHRIIKRNSHITVVVSDGKKD